MFCLYGSPERLSPSIFSLTCYNGDVKLYYKHCLNIVGDYENKETQNNGRTIWTTILGRTLEDKDG